jgi:hypothetical protein
VLYDAYGREIYAGGVHSDDVRDAIQAAALADDFALASEIAGRYGWSNICLRCAVVAPMHKHWTQSRQWPVCGECKEILQPTSTSFADVKCYMHGLITRDVQ